MQQLLEVWTGEEPEQGKLNVDSIVQANGGSQSSAGR